MTRKNVRLLFPETQKPRAKRRVMMHLFDAGDPGYVFDGDYIARFECSKCGRKTGWLMMQTITEGRRGVPCPKCNKSSRREILEILKRKTLHT